MTDMDMPLPEPVAWQEYNNDPDFPPHCYWAECSEWEAKNCVPADKTRGLFTADQLRARDAQWRAIVATEVAKERERIRTAIMAQHAAAKGQHNLYHCLSVELFGDEAIRAAAPPQCTDQPSEPQ